MKPCHFSLLLGQAKAMMAAHDEVATRPEDDAGLESPFSMVLLRSELARDLQSVHDNLCASGLVHLRINK